MPKLQGTEPGGTDEDLTFSPSQTQTPGATALPGLRMGKKGTRKGAEDTKAQLLPREEPTAAVPARPTHGTRLTHNLEEMTHIYGVFYCTNLPVNNTENGFLLCR